MKSNFKFIFYLCAAAMLTSCGNVLENTYSKKSAEGDLERIRAIGGLNNDDYELLTNYMLKNGLIDPDLKHIDQKYAEILAEARKDKAKMDKLKAHSKKIEGDMSQFVNDHQDHMHNALIMIPERSEIRKDLSSKNSLIYKMVFVNPGDRTIKAFKGKFTFFDVFNTELKSVSFTFNDQIEVFDTLRLTHPIEFNNLKGTDIYITEDYKDLKVVWQPTKILFTDGSILE